MKTRKQIEEEIVKKEERIKLYSDFWESFDDNDKYSPASRLPKLEIAFLKKEIELLNWVII